MSMFRRRAATDTPYPGDTFPRQWLQLPAGGLWANRGFLNLWAAESIAQFGSQLSPVAIPLLAALTLGATPFQMGLLTAASRFPVVLIGLFAGVWVDRHPRKPILLATDIGRAITMMCIPAAAMADALSMNLLIVVSIMLGFQDVLFNAAYPSILPSIVERPELADANGKLSSSMAVSQVAGPAAAGSLVSILSGPLVMAINACTYLGSAFFIRRIEVDERQAHEPPARQHIIHEMREGFDALFSSPLLRALALTNATINFFGWMFLALYVIYMTEDLGLSATGVGLVFASGGIGSFVASLMTSRIAQRLGVGRAIVWGAIGFGLFCMVTVGAIAFPDHALPLVIVGEAGSWMSLVVFSVLAISLRQSVTPNRLLGRVSTSNSMMWQGAAALGGVCGGYLGQRLGVQETLVIGCVGMLAAAGWVMASPIRHLTAMPTLGDPDSIV